MTPGPSDPQVDLAALILRARQRLPKSHRALLQQINAQDLVVDDWPAGVLNLYRTIRETPPTADQLRDALAAWLEGVRVVAFNGPYLRRALAAAQLDSPSVQSVIDNLAWHEYGHALSATRATEDLRRDGPRLLELLPAGIREAVDYPGGYSRRQVFDEVIANIYPLMIGRAIQSNEYGAPHPEGRGDLDDAQERSIARLEQGLAKARRELGGHDEG